MKIQQIDGQAYRLPNSLTAYQRRMYVQLINWKWQHITKEPGYLKHRGKLIPYDAFLPDEYDQQGKMPHIYEPVRQHLAAYRRRNPFRLHPRFYHMASSQAANINLFLPILHHPLAGLILAGIPAAPGDFVNLATDQLDHGYCVEYWGGNFDPGRSGMGLLGDKTPGAGTDSDIAIAYRNQNQELCLWLIEHKLIENEFTTCGGYKSRRRKDNARYDCTRSFANILKDKKSCYYHGDSGYRYWQITETNQSFFANHEQHAQCPFRGGMNQLWRNQLLGMALAQQGRPFKQAHFSVVCHPDNRALDPSLTAYKDLIDNNSDFSFFTSDDVLAAAEAVHDPAIDAWIQWYSELYRP